MLFTAGVRDSLTLIREKIAFVKDVKLLESLTKPFRDILAMYVRFAETYSKTKASNCIIQDDKTTDHIVKYKCELLGYMGHMILFCEHVLPYIKSTLHDRALGQYWNVIRTTCKYFEKVVMDNEVFHVKLDPPPKKHSYRKGWTYY